VKSTGIAATLVAIVVTAVLVPAAPASSEAVVPAGFTLDLVTDRLTTPIDIAFTPDGRLFVVEQEGRVRIVQPDGSLLTFLDISAKVDSTDERGLSSIAFDPAFATTGHVFLDYTRKATASAPAHNRVVRVTANGNTAVPGSERLIFRLPDHDDTHHHGGSMTFGDDGKLYITTGDNVGGSSHLLSNLLGKVLRINKSGTIPSTNPFYRSLSNKRRAIWAAGLRNPFKIAEDPGANRLYINDVGDAAWEEIDRGVAGANYGWRLYEGPETDPAYADPLFAYGHEGDPATTGCSITGGAFSRGSDFPSHFDGDYFFADFCNGWIRSYDVGTGVASGFLTGATSIVDVAFGPDGRMYYVSRGGAGAAPIWAVDHPA
jgi:glucose/arabinose dehydrogenase